MARVVLRLDPVEADAVVEGQLLVDAPVVLEIPLHVPGTVLAVQHDAGLLQPVVVAERGVGERPVGIVRVVGVAVEPDGAVHRGEGGLVLGALMQVDATLEWCGLPNTLAILSVMSMVWLKFRNGVPLKDEVGPLGTPP